MTQEGDSHMTLVGRQCIARSAIGRRDAVKFTVSGVTEHGVYITSPESCSPGNLVSVANFRRLYALLGSRCGVLTEVEGIWRDIA